MADEDFFSDDGLDDLPDNAIAALEHNAISSTQKPAVQPSPQAPKHAKGRVNNAFAAVAIPTRPASSPPLSAPAPPSSDYGFEDEDVIDLDEPSMIVQSASGPTTNGTNQYGKGGQPRQPGLPASAVSRHARKPALDPETEAAFAAADAELGAQPSAAWAHAPHLQPNGHTEIDVTSLHTRIAALQAEQNRLQQSEQMARNAAMARQGEIAIVRANQEKATKEYERRIAVMQKLHAEQAAVVKAEIEAGKKEREKMGTDNRFLQHDLAQETEKAKRLNGAGKARPLVGGKGKETPKKAKRVGRGDGFEDEEVRMVSPSRSREKSKDTTPKHGAKRRRTANDSPVASLSFAQPAELVREDSNGQGQNFLEQQVTLVQAKADDRYDFIQRLLRHCPHEGHERSIETLTKHNFPTEPNRSVSAMLMDELSRPVQGHQSDHLPLKLSHACLRLWSRCLDEKCYSPLYLLLDLVNFALYAQLSAVVTQLLEEAVPICMRTIDLVAVPTAKASTNPAFSTNMNRDAHEKLIEEVDVDEIMEFLLRLAEAATVVGPDKVEEFWGRMDFSFTLLMLNKAQPISQSTTALHILTTSCLSATFGTIPSLSADDDRVEKQTKQETAIVDRMTILLFEIPEPPMDEPPYSELELAALRNEILAVFRALCQTDHGSLLIAQHRSAIGRLVRFLHGQIEKLYLRSYAEEGAPSVVAVAAAPEEDEAARPNPTAHALTIATINTTTRLLHYILRTHDSIIDLGTKLQAVHGGYHKFLVSMTRIAFSDQLVLEHGLEDEVAEAAHAVLDGLLSPEEGEAVGRAVETPGGTNGETLGGWREGEVEGLDETMADADAG
ncbi:hypothetical protein B0A50_02812 [Salinomyces thailandicus]|uniref:DNA repair protein Rad26 n=1 Tax=Salinomyces thailandicus TaxID=706561 RepID=A0A4U0U4Q4_9PEZI|nr:hypothetical protein B0A50_02812 [Salinomyces thailandica]